MELRPRAPREADLSSASFKVPASVTSRQVSPKRGEDAPWMTAAHGEGAATLAENTPVGRADSPLSCNDDLNMPE